MKLFVGDAFGKPCMHQTRIEPCEILAFRMVTMNITVMLYATSGSVVASC
jgi:uncharacterized protein (DUF433 family)